MTGGEDKTIRIYNNTLVRHRYVGSNVTDIATAALTDTSDKSAPRSANNSHANNTTDDNNNSSYGYGECVAVLKGHRDSVTCLAVMSDGRIVSGSNDYNLRVWSNGTQGSKSRITTRQQQQDTNSSTAAGTAVSVGGVGNGGYVCEFVLTGHTFTITHVLIGYNNRIISYSEDNHFKSWDASDGQCEKTRFVPGVTALTQLVDGRIITTSSIHSTVSGNNNAAAAVDNKKIMILDYDLLPEQSLTGHTDVVTCMASNRSTNTNSSGGSSHFDVITGHKNNLLHLWDVDLDMAEATVTDNIAIAVSTSIDNNDNDGNEDKTAAADTTTSTKDTSNDDDVISTSAAKVELKPHKQHERHPFSVKNILILSDGTVVTSGTNDRVLRVWGALKGSAAGNSSDSNTDTRSMSAMDASCDCDYVLEGHTGKINCITVHSVGLFERVISGSADYTIRFWSSVAWGTCERVLTDFHDSISCLVVLQDGRLVAGSSDRNLRVWDTDGKCEHVLSAHTGVITCVVALPDGRIVSGGNDKTVRIWSGEYGVLEKTLKSDGDQVRHIAVIEKGEKLITQDYFGDYFLWTIASSKYERIDQAMYSKLLAIEERAAVVVIQSTTAGGGDSAHHQQLSERDREEVASYGLDTPHSSNSSVGTTATSSSSSSHVVCRAMTSSTIAYGLDNGDVYVLRRNNDISNDKS